ncbi:MAG: helix-turn-helix domain-containing protein [Bacteroidota bacterium]
MLLYLSLFSIAISILLAIYNWRVNKNALLISGIFIIFATYTITHYFTVYSSSNFWLGIFYANFSPLWYLPGPFLYFYVRSTLTDTRAIKSWKDSLHFTPSIIHLISIAPYLFSPLSNKIENARKIHADLNYIVQNQINLFYTTELAFISRPLLIIAYCIACFYLLFKNTRNISNQNTITQIQIKTSYRWLLVLVICLLLVCCGFLYLTSELAGKELTKFSLESKFAHLFSGFIIFLLPSCLILFFPKVLYGMPMLSPQANPKKEKSINIKREVIDNDPFNEVALQMIDYLTREKPYLNPAFEISDLSIRMQIPQHHIAYCFSSILDTKFTSYRSKLRVEHAKELLKSGTADTLSIDGIGAQSGFSSRSSFYATFKAETGLTPSQYLESI